MLDEVTRRAGEFADAREADTVGTPDLLFAVLDVYGQLFDRVLYMRGTSREELVERLVGAAGARRQRTARRGAAALAALARARGSPRACG